MTKVTHYPFESLKSFGKTQILLVNAMAAFMKDRQVRQVGEILNERSKKWLSSGLKVHLRVDDLVSSLQDLGEMDHKIALEFYHPDSQSSVYVVTDNELVLFMAKKMLGGNDSPKTVTKFSPLVCGTFEYFILHLLEAWNQAAPDLTLRYRRLLYEDGDDGLNQMSLNQCLSLQGHLELGSEKFGCVILCPLEILANYKENQKRPPLKEESLKKFDHLRTLVWSEIGRVKLPPSDLAQIQKGDVLLLDEMISQFDGKKLSGRVQIGFGEGKGYFQGKIHDAENITVQVEDFFLKEDSNYE